MQRQATRTRRLRALAADLVDLEQCHALALGLGSMVPLPRRGHGRGRRDARQVGHAGAGDDRGPERAKAECGTVGPKTATDRRAHRRGEVQRRRVVGDEHSGAARSAPPRRGAAASRRESARSAGPATCRGERRVVLASSDHDHHDGPLEPGGDELGDSTGQRLVPQIDAGRHADERSVDGRRARASASAAAGRRRVSRARVGG